MALAYDIGLDPLTQDLPVFPTHISGVDLTLQRMKIRLKRFLGEWVLDTTKGLPYLAWTQEKPLNVPGMSAVIRTEIESTPGVLRVNDFSGAFDYRDQRVRFTGTVILDNEIAVTSEILVASTISGNTTPAVIMFNRSGFI